LPELVPPRAPVPATAPDDPRVGHLVGRGLAAGEPPRAVLLGFPTDVGVRRNGGRPGAAEGPDTIRRLLNRLTPDADAPERFVALLRKTLDAGDLAVTDDLERDQDAFGEVMAGFLARGSFVLVLGGGHETAFGQFLGHAAVGRPVDVLNLDAHPDVREPGEGRRPGGRSGGRMGHSGSPFRQALDHPSGACRRYRVAGILPWSAARAHLDLVAARGGAWVAARDLDRARLGELFGSLGDPGMVSFDLDAVDQGFAPGVSAPAVRGLSAELWLEAAFLAGRTPAVASAGIAELSPPLDRDDAAARLAAVTAWEILRGLAART
jgi:formiminoglutamase